MPKCPLSYTGSPVEVGVGDQGVKAGGGNVLGERIRLPMVGLIDCIPSSSPHGWCKPSLDQACRMKAKVLFLVYPLQGLHAHRLPSTHYTPNPHWNITVGLASSATHRL